MKCFLRSSVVQTARRANNDNLLHFCYLYKSRFVSRLLGLSILCFPTIFYININLSVTKLPSLSRFGHSAIAPLKKQITFVICFSPKPAMSYFPRQRQTKKKILKNKYELFRLTPPLSSFAPLSHFTLQAAFFSYSLNRTLCKMRSLPALAGDSQDYKTFLS